MCAHDLVRFATYRLLNQGQDTRNAAPLRMGVRPRFAAFHLSLFTFHSSPEQELVPTVTLGYWLFARSAQRYPRHAIRSDCFEKQHSLQNFSNQTETESYHLDTER